MKEVVFHGGALDAAIVRHGGQREDWLDLSTGINPVPYPVPTLAIEAWARLPDREAEERLIAAARTCHGVPQGLGVFPAPGTQALIEALPRILPGRTATIVAPEAGTYGEHEFCCAKAGRHVRRAASPDLVGKDETLAIVVNPNNPDGHAWPRETIAAVARRMHASGGTLIVDEAFCDVRPDKSIIPHALPNVIVLRSFGKFFGLAGVRLGFAIGTDDTVAMLARWFGPWAVSGAALELGARALADKKWIRAARERLENDSIRLSKLLQNHGLSLAGRNGLFVLASHPGALRIAQELARRHILTRPFADRPALIRFGLCANQEQFERLDAALAAVRCERP